MLHWMVCVTFHTAAYRTTVIATTPTRPLLHNTVLVLTPIAIVTGLWWTVTWDHCARASFACRRTTFPVTNGRNAYRSRSGFRICIPTATVSPRWPWCHCAVSVGTFRTVKVFLTRALSRGITVRRSGSCDVAVTRTAFRGGKKRAGICCENGNKIKLSFHLKYWISILRRLHLVLKYVQ